VVVLVTVVVDSLDDTVLVVAVYVVDVRVGGVVLVVVVDSVVVKGFFVVLVCVCVVLVVIRGHPNCNFGLYAHESNKFIWCEPSLHSLSPGLSAQ